MNAWSQLPNAALIDRVLAHVKAHPEKWRGTWGAAWGVAWDAAWDAAYGAAREAAWNAARDAVQKAPLEALWNARYACYALVAWDDCGYLLDYTPAQMQALLAIDPTYHAARLLLPAVVAMETTS